MTIDGIPNNVYNINRINMLELKSKTMKTSRLFLLIGFMTGLIINKDEFKDVHLGDGDTASFVYDLVHKSSQEKEAFFKKLDDLFGFYVPRINNFSLGVNKEGEFTFYVNDEGISSISGILPFEMKFKNVTLPKKKKGYSPKKRKPRKSYK